MAYPRRGFVPARKVADGDIRNFPVTLGGETLAVGDAVTLLNGVISRASAGSGITNTIGGGVVLAVYDANNRPLTHATSKILTSGASGRADVCIDPYMTYTVRFDASIGQAQVGENVTIDQSAPNSTLGLSGQAVAIVSADQGAMFKIINLSPFEELLGKETGYGPGQGVEVAFNNHFLRAPTNNV